MTPTKIELITHSQRLAEHMRVQMEELLEVVRNTTTLYTEHTQYMELLLAQMNEEKGNDEEEDTPAPEV